MKVRGSGKDQGESARRQAHHRKTIKINTVRNSITDMQRRSKQALKISLVGGRMGCLWWTPRCSQGTCCGWQRQASVGRPLATSACCLAPQLLTYRSLEALVPWEMTSTSCLPQGIRVHEMLPAPLSQGCCRGSAGGAGAIPVWPIPVCPTIPLVRRKAVGSCSTWPSINSERVHFKSAKGLVRRERRIQFSRVCFAGKFNCSQFAFVRVLRS